MRTLLGAVVGVLLGAAVIAALNASGIQDMWPVLPASVLAGLAMRFLGSSGNSIYLRGALAAVATAVAAVAGPMIATQVLSAQAGGAAPTVSGSNTAPMAEAESTEGDTEPVEIETPESERVELPSTTPRQGMQRPVRDPFGAPLDIVVLAVGCLVAYQLGKGPVPLLREEGADADGGQPDAGQPAPDPSGTDQPAPDEPASDEQAGNRVEG